ncbi:MAG: nucleotidyltransferase family protein [Parvularculaceae bacterium]
MTPKQPKIAALLLAAGHSSRFGGNKLAAKIGGHSILERSATALAKANCCWLIAVSAPATPLPPDLGFQSIENQERDEGIASSIRLGVSRADDLGAEGVLIALADMPYVETHHLQALIDHALATPAQLSFTAAGDLRLAPAAFLRRWFPALLALHGDEGARSIIRDAPDNAGVETLIASLRDIDRLEDLKP